MVATGGGRQIPTTTLGLDRRPVIYIKARISKYRKISNNTP